MLLDRTMPKATSRALSLLTPAGLAAALLLTGGCKFSPSEPDNGSDSTTTATDGSQALQGPGQGLSVTAQQNATLVDWYLEQAENYAQNNKLESARNQVLKAREISPADERVNRRLAALNAQLGSQVNTFAQQAEIKEERARSRVTNAIAVARRALSRGDYRSALDALQDAELEVEVNSLYEWGELADEVEALLDEARQVQADVTEAEIRQAEAATRAQLADLEREEVRRRRANVDRLLDQAEVAFDNRRFPLAADLALRALEVDPRNRIADTLLKASQKAERDANQSRYYQEIGRRVRELNEQRGRLRIPQNEVLELDEKIADRATIRSANYSVDVAQSPQDIVLLERLATETINEIAFEEEDFSDTSKRIATITDIPIIITPSGREVIDGEGLVVNLQVTAPLSLENLLNQMTSQSPELAWTVFQGTVQITSRAEAGGNNIRKNIDVRDLVFPMTVFVAPKIDSIPTDDAGNFSEVPRTGGELEEKVSAFEIDTLVSTLRDATDPSYWDGDSGAQLEPVDNGHFLMITASPEKLKEVESILYDLRRASASVVTIESKFLTISQNFLQEVGVDFRGLGGAGNPGINATLDDITSGLDDNASQGLDNSGISDPAGSPSSGVFFNDGADGDLRARTENAFSSPLGNVLSSAGGLTQAISFLDDFQIQAIIRAVEKSQDVQELNGQTLTVLNNARGHVAVINQTAYVRDFDVEVAQASFIADPKVDVVQDGIVLDVKPVVKHNRREIVLDLEPTVAELLLPIPTFSTSLAGTTIPVTIQLPQLIIESFATTVTVPDGASILLGGLREVTSVERQAEVPLLAQIPILSFLFKQEGVSDEDRSLTVLLRATLTDVLDTMDSRR